MKVTPDRSQHHQVMRGSVDIKGVLQARVQVRLHRTSMYSSKVLAVLLLTAVTARGFHLNPSPGGYKADNSLNKERNHVALSRSTRGTDNGVQINAELCCNVTRLPMDEEWKQNEIKCMNDVSLKFGIEATHSYLISHLNSNETTCFADCLFRGNQLVDAGGKIITKAAVETLSKLFGISDRNTLDKISATCGKSNEGNGDAPGENYVCNTASEHFLTCAHAISFTNCPTEKQAQTDSCRRFWEEMKHNHH